MKRALPIYIIVISGLALIAFFLYQEWQLANTIVGVPLDDSWIHFQFANNLRNGHGFSFNPGIPTPGSTSPLWVVILAAIGTDYIIPSKIIGVLTYVGVGIVVYFIGKKFGLRVPYAFLAGLGSIFAGRLVWSAPSGMETTTFTLVTLLALWLFSNSTSERIDWYTSLVFGLACLLRPEGYLFLAVSGLIWLISISNNWFSIKSWMIAARHFIIAAIVVAPFILFTYQSTGQIFTNTFYVKSSTWGCEPGLAYFSWISLVFLFDNPILFPLAIFGTLNLLRQNEIKKHPGLLLAGGWWASLPIVFGFLAPCISGYYMRYTAPVIPFMMLVGAWGGQFLADLIAKWSASKSKPKDQLKIPIIPSLIFVGVCASLLISVIFWGPYYGQSVADIESMQVRVGKWLAENAPTDSVIAVNDIGAIGYFSNLEILDLGGLVSPEVIPLLIGKGPGEWDEGLAEYLREQNPDYLVIFPNWYPILVYNEFLEPIYSVKLKPRTIAGLPNITVVGGGEMTVFVFTEK